MKIITSGTSRIVFVFKDFVVKIPWINFVRLVKIFIRERRAGTLKERIEYKTGSSKMLVSIFLGFLILLKSNRQEYLFYKLNKSNLILMPTKGFLWGLILIQPRGQVMSSRMIRWQNIYRKIKAHEVSDRDLRNPENFSIFMDRIVVHDYGNIETQKAIVRNDFIHMFGETT